MIAAATVFGPGLVLLLALGVRQGIVLLGATPAASVGVALIVASVCGWFDVRFGPTPLLVAVAGLAVAGGLWWAARHWGARLWWTGRRGGACLWRTGRRWGARLWVAGRYWGARGSRAGWRWADRRWPGLRRPGVGWLGVRSRGARRPGARRPGARRASVRLPGMWARGVRRLGRPVAPPAYTARPLLPRLPALTGLAAQLAGTVFVITGAGLAVQAWYWGLGRWSTWNQDHDPILHAVLTAYIQRTGRGAPWQVMPADVSLGEQATVYYPDGFHLMAAVLGASFGDPVTGMNLAAAMLLGAAWTASAGALGAVGARWLRGDPGWVALGAGMASVVAAGLYRPAIQLARDNGLLPNAVAMVLVPGVVAAILVLKPRGWGGAVGVGVACAGIVSVHPSSGLSVGLTVLVIWLARLFDRDGRTELRAQWSVLVVVLGLGAVATAPVLAGALAVRDRIAAFPPDVSNFPLAQALGVVLPLNYGGMFDGRSTVQVWPTALLLAGVATALVLRRAVPLVVVWVSWVVISLLAFRNPTGITAPILGFFYNSAGRVQSHIGVFAPALAALGAFGLLLALLAGLRELNPADRLVATVRDRLAGMPPRPCLPLLGKQRAHSTPEPAPEDEPAGSLPIGIGGPGTVRVRKGGRGVAGFGVLVMTLFIVGYLAGPSRGYLQTNAVALSQRWSNPEFTRVDADDVAAANWLRKRVQPGQRIMNSPNDGSTYLYVHHDLPVMEISTLGVPGFPYTWQLMQRFRFLTFDPVVRRLILDFNIAWVYVDTRAPLIGADGAPDNWTGGGLMTTVSGLEGLESTPGLILAYVSGAVRIYKVDLEEIRQLDESF